MKYFYVKAGGTASGYNVYYTSPKTGSWSTAFSSTAEYYNTLSDAYYGAYNQTDFGDTIICVSHLYAATNESFAAGNNKIGAVLSVDDTAIEKLKYGASVALSNGSNYSCLCPVSYWAYGFNQVFNTVASNYDSVVGFGGTIAENITFAYNIGTDYMPDMDLTVGSLSAFCKDMVIDADIASTRITLTPYSTLINTKIIHTTSSTVALFNGVDNIYSDKCCVFIGCDFTAANRPIISYAKTDSYYMPYGMYFEGCVFASYNYPYYIGHADTTPERYLITRTIPAYIHHNCTSSPTASLPRNYIKYASGYSQHINTSYRDDGAVWNSNGDKYAISVSVNSVAGYDLDNCVKLYQIFYVSSFYLDLSRQQTCTLYLKDTVGLTKDKIWLEAYYMSIGPEANTRVATGASTKEFSLDSGGGAALATSTKTWNSSTTGSKKIDITFGGDGDSKSIVFFYVGVQQGNSIIFCPKIEY